MSEPEMTQARTADGARLWAAAQALARAADAVRGGEASRVPPLLFLTDPDRTPRPWEIAERMPAGSGVVYRSFGAADALETAMRLRSVTLERGVRLLIGLDADLAQHVDADGLHLPERALAQAADLFVRRPDWVLTGAVHSVDVALASRDLDAVILSPIFAAGGASGAKPPLGLAALQRATAGPTRVIALGGMTAATADRLETTGAYGIAAVSGLAENR